MGKQITRIVFSRNETMGKQITRIALGVRLPLVSTKDLLHDPFVFVKNIEIASSTYDVLLTPSTSS